MLSIMSVCNFNSNVFRAFRNGYWLLGSLQTQRIVSSNRYYTCNNRFVCKKQVECSFSKTYCTNTNQKGYPRISNLPIHIWPGFFSSLAVTYKSHFVIKRNIDEEFDLREFVLASKTAVKIVSGHLATGSFDKLYGLVTPDLLEELRFSLKSFSLQQQSELAVDQKDIVACYTNNIKVIFPNEEPELVKWGIGDMPKQRYIEISMTYHVVKGFHISADDHVRALVSPNFDKNLYVLTYNFIRDFTQGKNCSWVINGLNHCKPLDDSE